MPCNFCKFQISGSSLNDRASSVSYNPKAFAWILLRNRWSIGQPDFPTQNQNQSDFGGPSILVFSPPVSKACHKLSAANDFYSFLLFFLVSLLKRVCSNWCRVDICLSKTNLFGTLWSGDGPFLACENVGRMLGHSNPACDFFFLKWRLVEVSGDCRLVEISGDCRLV